MDASGSRSASAQPFGFGSRSTNVQIVNYECEKQSSAYLLNLCYCGDNQEPTVTKSLALGKASKRLKVGIPNY